MSKSLNFIDRTKFPQPFCSRSELLLQEKHGSDGFWMVPYSGVSTDRRLALKDRGGEVSLMRR